MVQRRDHGPSALDEGGEGYDVHSTSHTHTHTQLRNFTSMLFIEKF